MIVEDEPDIGWLTKVVLEEEGARAVWAKSAREAISLTREMRPDLVLLDAVLPDGEGSAVAAEMRATDRSDVPVIVMSALDGASGMAVAREAQALAFLEKPFGLDHLLEVVERGLAASPTVTV